MSVVTPVGDTIIVNRVYRNCVIQIETARLFVDLILMSFRDFDVILAWIG